MPVQGEVIGTIKPEAERAEDHKKALREAAGPMIEAMRACLADGFTAEFNFAPDQYGRMGIQGLAVVKRY